MIKNKAAKALIIGTCLVVSTSLGVYADTTNVEVKPAIELKAVDESQIMTIQIESIKNEDALSKKQQEIDQYVFVDHRDELVQKGINITSSGVVGDVVEVGIVPYDVKSADYLYEVFGKDMVKIVDGQQAVPLDLVTATSDISAQAGIAEQKDVSFFATIINSIVEWFKSIF